jgi:hypothetical protein
MSKRVLAWSVVAAMVVGGTGYALGARAASREPEACTPAAVTQRHDAPSAAPIVPDAPVLVTTRAPSPPVSHETPAVAPRPRHDEGPLAIRRMTLTHGIEDHEPIDDASIFEATDERVFAFVELANPGDEERSLDVTFESAARTSGHVTLRVPAHMPRYRTWAWTRGAHAPGEWTAVVRDEDGRVLSRETFAVQ